MSYLRLFNTLSDGYEAAFIRLFNAVTRGYNHALVERPAHRRKPRGLSAWRERKHKRERKNKNVEKAAALLEKFRSWEGDGLPMRILAYLRKIDPYVFEELVLTALAEQGLSVTRNESYSGDGGLDGEFCYKGRRYLMQAKRYEGAINAEHVTDFGKLIEERRAQGGLFIHTGRTPPKAYKQMGRAQTVTLISGDKLIKLLRGKQFIAWNETPSLRRGFASASRR